MVQIAKYLSVCVIVLLSSKNIGARKLPEDCDYGEQSGQTGLYSSGRAQSSQYIMPDGSEVTSSKGSSISQDGIRRTFHELKKEANNYISKTNEFNDGFLGAKIPQISGFQEVPYVPYFKKESYLTGQQSGSSSSAQSESNGSFQYVGQHQFPTLPVESKVTTYEKSKLRKVFSSDGSSSYPDVPGEFDINQIQGSNSNANANTYVYQPAQPVGVQNGYATHSQQKSESVKVVGSNVNLLPNTNQQPFYGRRPVFHDVQQGYRGSNEHDIRVADKNLNNPITLPAENIKLLPAALDGSQSSSSSFQKLESYSHKQDANENIPVAFTNLKPNTFTTNVLTLPRNNDEGSPSFYQKTRPSMAVQNQESHKHNEGVNTFITQQIPAMVPNPNEQIVVRETHYPAETNYNEQRVDEQKESQVSQTTADEIDTLKPVKSDSFYEDGYGSSTARKVVVGAPHYDGHRVKYTIKIQAPAVDTVRTAQSVKQEAHSQSISSIGQTIPSNSDASSPVPGVWVPVPADEIEEASSSQTSFNVHEPNPLGLGRLPGHASAGGYPNGYAHDYVSGDSINIPILLGGEPQNVGVSTGSKSTSTKVSKSETHVRESVGGSQLGSKLATDSRGTLYDGASSLDNLNVPVTGYVAPKVVSNKQRSSSSSHYFTSNGYGVGDQLVPNSDIYARPGDANFLQNSQLSTYQKVKNGNVDSDAELCTSCVPSSADSFGVPKRTSYGFSKSFASHSSNVNGKKTENREASVTVDDNGKIDSYHVKS